jgi:hypothetical protein
MAEPALRFLDGPAAAELLRRRLNAELEELAEPLIQEAVAKLEQRLRRSLGAMLIGMLDQTVNVYRDERQLVITLNQPRQEKSHG